MGRHTRIAAVVALWVGFVGTPVASAADTTVIVLGIRSLEGDDDFARSLTGALRSAASQVPSWALDTREVSLAQMALAHGCDEPDASCMANVAGALGVQGVIYGTTRRTGAGSQYDYSVALYFFNAATGQIEGSVADTIPRIQSDIDELRPRAERYIRQFAGGEGTGTLRVTVNVPAASIQIDGERAGSTDAEGGFEATLPTGRHRVEVDASGYTAFRGTVSVVPDEESVMEVTLDREGGEAAAGVTWPTYVSYGAALLFGGVTLYTWVRLDQIQEDLKPYRETVDIGLNACSQARNGFGGDAGRAAANDCDDADRFERLEWVSIGGFVLGLAAGTYFLYSDLAESDEEEERADSGRNLQLSVNPSFGAHGAFVDTTLRF